MYNEYMEELENRDFEDLASEIDSADYWEVENYRSIENEREYIERLERKYYKA